MRVLSIGTDRKLFEEGSSVFERQVAYADILGELETIVLTKGKYNSARSGKLTAIPTNSSSKFLYFRDVWRIVHTLARPDVITSQDPFETGLIALFLARRLKVPLHVQVHTDFASREFARHSFRNWLRQRIAWFVLKRAARIRVILGRTADDIAAKGISTPITVLPIFVDIAKFGAIPRTKHPRWKIAILSVGRFEREKHFEVSIQALAAARTKGHDVGLTLVGEGSLRQHYYRYAQRLRVADRLDMIGWQHNLANQYSMADIVIVPSKYEGYGLVIVEALAAGIPVLSTDVGIAREAGAMVFSAKEIPHALVRWIENGPRMASLATRPYKDFEEYVTKYCADIAATIKAVV